MLLVGNYVTEEYFCRITNLKLWYFKMTMFEDYIKHADLLTLLEHDTSLLKLYHTGSFGQVSLWDLVEECSALIVRQE